VTGETGVGKTLTALSFIINGIMKYGEPAIYVSVDETYEQFINGTKRFGWDLEPLMQQGYFQILVPEMDLIETIRQKDPVTVAKSMVQAITDYANSVEAQRIVIDPIAPLVTLEKDVQVLREYIRTLVMGDREGCWGNHYNNHGGPHGLLKHIQVWSGGIPGGWGTGSWNN